MDLKYLWVWICIPCVLLRIAQVQATEIVNICYNSTLEGFRLNANVLMSKVAYERIDCVMECATEECCRSINYKKTSSLQNETNCEMLHNVVYNKSERLLKPNVSYDYVYLINPQKGYNESCFTKVHVLDSDILSAEQPEFTKNVTEWLPMTGNWSICWRATRDGWESGIFHQRCDSKIPTLTVVKVVKDNKTFLFGGLATAPWAGDSYTSAPGSFLFSLRNKDDLPPFKSPLKNQSDEHAILGENRFGPTFSDGHDLFIANHGSSNTHSFANLGYKYQAPSGYTFGDKTKSLLAGSYHFTPAEVEVLYLT